MQTESINVASSILDKFLLDVHTIQYTLNSLLAITFLLEEHPDDEMLNHTKEQGNILVTTILPSAVAMRELIKDKFINQLNEEDKRIYLQTSEILTSIASNSDATASLTATSDKVH